MRPLFLFIEQRHIFQQVCPFSEVPHSITNFPATWHTFIIASLSSYLCNHAMSASTVLRVQPTIARPKDFNKRLCLPVLDLCNTAEFLQAFSMICITIPQLLHWTSLRSFETAASTVAIFKDKSNKKNVDSSFIPMFGRAVEPVLR